MLKKPYDWGTPLCTTDGDGARTCCEKWQENDRNVGVHQEALRLKQQEWWFDYKKLNGHMSSWRTARISSRFNSFKNYPTFWSQQQKCVVRETNVGMSLAILVSWGTIGCQQTMWTQRTIGGLMPPNRGDDVFRSGWWEMLANAGKMWWEKPWVFR